MSPWRNSTGRSEPVARARASLIMARLRSTPTRPTRWRHEARQASDVVARAATHVEDLLTGLEIETGDHPLLDGLDLGETIDEIEEPDEGAGVGLFVDG